MNHTVRLLSIPHKKWSHQSLLSRTEKTIIATTSPASDAPHDRYLPSLSDSASVPCESFTNPNSCEESLLKTTFGKSDVSSSNQPNSPITCALRKRTSQSIVVRGESRTPTIIVIHPDLLPPPELCEIILKQSEKNNILGSTFFNY